MKKSYRLMSVSIMLSLAMLTACGTTSSKEASKTASATSQTSMSSSKKTAESSSSKMADSTEVQTSLSAEEEMSDEMETTETGTAQSTTSANSSSIDLTALSAGDYTSIAGTWADDQGHTMVVSADGSVEKSSANAGYELKFEGLDEGIYYATIYNPNSKTDSMGFIVIPAGVVNPHIASQLGQDSIVMGQSESADYHPYTRQ